MSEHEINKILGPFRPLRFCGKVILENLFQKREKNGTVCAFVMRRSLTLRSASPRSFESDSGGRCKNCKLHVDGVSLKMLDVKMGLVLQKEIFIRKSNH